MAEQLRVFVSHSHEDNEFCQAIVAALRDAGADVWYDEHNLGSGVLRREIMGELSVRPVFLVVLSKAAFASGWVQDECEWAYNLYRRKPERLILPVVCAPYDPDDFDTLLYIESMKRIEAPGNQPYPTVAAIHHLLRALALTPAGEAPVSTAPQPTESVDDLLTRGRALAAQKKFAEALPLFERATQLAPSSFEAWGGLAYALGCLDRPKEQLAACDRALAIDNTQAWIWGNKGTALSDLGSEDAALVAFNQALALDPNDVDALSNMGVTFRQLRRYQEALAAFDRALGLAPNFPNAWANKGNVLYDLGLFEEALAAYDRFLQLSSNINMIGGVFRAWLNKAQVLRRLGRTAEAEAAEQRARELGWQG